MAQSNDNHRVEREARLQWVPIVAMKVSPMAQRELNQARVDHLASNFDPEQIGTPTVNKRDGHFFIIDGQHRVEAMKQMGWGDQKVECWLYIGLTEAQEAERFLTLNDYLAVNALSKFKVGVTAGRPQESEIDDIVRAAGLTVSRSKAPNGIGCVGTLTRLYKRSGPATLTRTLHIARDAYGDAGLEAAVIDGIGLLCQRYNGQLDDGQAVQRLSAVHGGVNGLMGKARAAHKQRLGPLAHCVAASAVEIINGGKGGKKLPVWWSSR